MTRRNVLALGLLAAGCSGELRGDRDASVPTPPAIECPAAPPLVDTSAPTRVVGDGRPESCTAAALRDAVAAGGVVTFDCGGARTIDVERAIEVSADVVIDGGGLVTLSGGGDTRILSVPSSFERDTPHLVVQRLAFEDGRSGAAGGDDRTTGGGAIHRTGGRLTVIGCTFVGNRGPSRGQDVAGGAIYSLGGGPTIVAGSSFSDNEASNGGAIGRLANDLANGGAAFDGNRATGTGGNPGDGGNGGAIYVDGADEATTLCGVALTSNGGNAFGGALFRVSNTANGTFAMDRSTVSHNVLDDSFERGSSGGLYLQGLSIAITASTIASNQAPFAGGLFIGPGSRIEATNTTIAHNVASRGLGGGVVFSDGVTGAFLHVTIARNRAPNDVAFAAATLGGTGVTFRNVVIADNEAGNGYNPISCAARHGDGGGNVQWPVARSGGGSDDPGALCAAGALVMDPRLGEIADHGGPTPTMVPAAGSPALGRGMGCAPTDQRGQPRTADGCTSGAVEASP